LKTAIFTATESRKVYHWTTTTTWHGWVIFLGFRKKYL